MQQVGGDEVMRILRQFLLCQRRNQMIDITRTDKEQQYATDELGKPVEAFENNANLKDRIQPVLRFEHCYLRAQMITPGASL
jgi:hypothetical protein